MLRTSMVILITATLLCVGSVATFAQVEYTTWGQLKFGNPDLPMASGGIASSAEVDDAINGLLMSEVFRLAKDVGFRVPDIATPNYPNAAEAQEILLWRIDLCTYLDAECSFEMIVECTDVILSDRSPVVAE